MSRSEMAVFTNMCMIEDGQGRVVVQDRADTKWPGIVFPGGHVEPREGFVDSVIREVKEETGLLIKQPALCGVKQFYNDEGSRYVVMLFRTAQFEGELESSEEGEVFWVRREDLGNYVMADGFREMLRVFDEEMVSEVYFSSEGGTQTIRYF